MFEPQKAPLLGKAPLVARQRRGGFFHTLIFLGTKKVTNVNNHPVPLGQLSFVSAIGAFWCCILFDASLV